MLHIPDGHVRRYVTETLAAHPVVGLVVGPTTQTRSERAARERCGVSAAETTLGALDLEGDGFVLFTNRALYWTNQGQQVALPYLRFRHEFPCVSTTHVDFGDGVARLIGSRAPALAVLLNALLDRIHPPKLR
jgi:hypothetical protein